MQKQLVLVLDLDPASGDGKTVYSVLKSSIDSESNVEYHSCEPSEVGAIARCFDKLVSQLRPTLLCIILSTSLLNESELLAHLCGKRQIPIIAFTKDGGQDALETLHKAGAGEYLTSPLDPKDILPRVRRFLEKTSEPRQSIAPEDELYLRTLVGESRVFVTEVNKIPMIARSESSVLITGETGTGKELFARAIHDLSPRAGKPYIPINCGAIPIELVENELFGHERGAFTGAGSFIPGLVETANGGTLFLDEVNSLPMPAQAKLLRFLQEKEYRPLGSSRIIKADVRVISAANVDIEEAINDGRMRLDLYHRLNVITINLPPLRNRREDIPLLANHFLHKHKIGSDGVAEEFSPDAMHLLLFYEWPGNVRELEHVIERLIVMCRQRLISDIEVSQAIGKMPPRSLRNAKQEFERDYIQGVLRICGGNLAQSARLIQVDKPNLRRLIRKYQIDLTGFRQEAQKKRSPRSGKNKT